jgi:GTPase SAR1 family protein
MNVVVSFHFCSYGYKRAMVNIYSFITMAPPVVDFRLKNESAMLICGPSQSGKSTFLHSLLADENIFVTKFSKIYWYYGQYDDALDAKSDKYILNQGLPESFSDIEPYSCIVLDDLMSEAKNHVGVTGLFTKLVHHKKLFVVMLTQNYYQKSEECRTRRLNVQYLVLFKNPCDATQISIMSRQMYPHDFKFLPNAFKQATSKPFGYLFIDFRQDTPDKYRIRTNILTCDTEPMKIYASHKVG